MRHSRYFLALLALLCSVSLADEHDHLYKPGDDVIVWANSVGPYANRQETYEYFQLPYCKGAKEHAHHHETLGEALVGMSLVNSGIEIHFKEVVENGTVCSESDTPKELTSKQLQLFRYAVGNYYWFSMYVDNLPIGAFVGEVDEADNNALYLYTHMDYVFSYNKDQIIAVNLTMGNRYSLATGAKAKTYPKFTYSVKWIPTKDSFEDRFDRYLDSEFFEHKIHWFSIFNSFMMVIFLTVFVAIIFLRTLRLDLARYDKEEDYGDLEKEIGDEYGWKLIHGDVFRSPSNLSLFSALYGSGVQLCLLAVMVVLYTIIGDLYVERASILTATIFLYALTSIAAGYVSGSHYSQYGGKSWISTMFLTAGLWPGLVSAASLLINFVAIYYSSTKAIPFGTMIAVICIWLFLVFPLTLVGTIIGRNWNGQPHFPTRVNPIPRPIPEKPWYGEPLIIMLVGGLLPFGSIFIEMYFVFTSFWAYKIYYVYGFMFLVLLILWIVTSCVTIVACYFSLNAEDHKWHWITFLTGGSISLYVYLYAIYYFFARTKMYGLFQTSFYFGYTAVICFGLLIMCGSVGYLSASLFVKKIYATVKID